MEHIESKLSNFTIGSSNKNTEEDGSEQSGSHKHRLSPGQTVFNKI